MAVRVVPVTSPDRDPGPSSIGGRARLPRGRYPRCVHCDAKMVLFFQAELGPWDDVPFPTGSQLSVMMCPTHNEAVLHPAEWISGPTVRTPEAFWNDKEYWHVFFQLSPAGTETKTHPPDPFLEPHLLRFEPFEEETEPFEDTDLVRGARGFKIGGAPAWHQEARRYVCACGADMAFLAQVPSGYVFPKREDAPEQPNTSDSKGYTLTLGNRVFLFACTRACHPRSVWCVNQ